MTSSAWGDNTLHVTYASPESKTVNMKQSIKQENNQHIFRQKKAKILKTDDLDQDTKTLLKEEYLVLKRDVVYVRSDSIFPAVDYKMAVENIQYHAKELGTPVVLFSSKNIGESSRYFPNRFSPPQVINTQDPKEESRMNANNFTIPAGDLHSLDEYMINYFIKFHSITGVYPRDFTEKEKIMVGHDGVRVVVVAIKSPANGIIKENDIIKSINNQPILDINGFIETSNYLEKGTIKFEIIRDSEQMIKEISLN